FSKHAFSASPNMMSTCPATASPLGGFALAYSFWDRLLAKSRANVSGGLLFVRTAPFPPRLLPHPLLPLQSGLSQLSMLFGAAVNLLAKAFQEKLHQHSQNRNPSTRPVEHCGPRLHPRHGIDPAQPL